MNVSDLVTKLQQQGVQLAVEQDRLKVNAPKGVLTAPLQADIMSHKTAILAWLRAESVEDTPTLLNLAAIGRLIGGAGPSDRAGKAPVINPTVMAQQVTVTLRPLPAHFDNAPVLQFRETLRLTLEHYGVRILPWEQATRALGSRRPVRVVKPDIHAVIDVERPRQPLKSAIAEWFYRLYRCWARDQPLAVAEIIQLMSWAEDHAMQRLEDPTATQVILIRDFDQTFVEAVYQRKIALGIHTLVSQFAEIVISVADERIAILNMNLSDTVFAKDQLDHFVFKSLIPKIYVPIAPLPLSKFALGVYDPAQSAYAPKLMQLSQALAQTDLFPAGFKLDDVMPRRSHRDIVDAIVQGRTGVSYGFVAYAEPPRYVGEPEISPGEWANLAPTDCPGVRQNASGRRYLKTQLRQHDRYQQIPDIWLVCSRSGADKTNLNRQDVLRLGLTDRLQLELPVGLDPIADQIRPSYDTYVMVAIALAAALYAPELIATGAPIIHFHGYPAPSWFQAQEAYMGCANPSVPCGTYESGVFNFLGLHHLADQADQPLQLVGLIEPDHGINIMTPDLDYLLARLTAGLAAGEIELGGKHFAALARAAA